MEFPAKTIRVGLLWHSDRRPSYGTASSPITCHYILLILNHFTEAQ